MAASKTPWVRLETSRLVKELGVPVLPPGEKRPGSWAPKARTSRM